MKKQLKLNIKSENKISFSIKSNFFYYDVSLQKRDVYIDILPPEDINQNAISYYNKLQIFLDALNKNKETNKIEKLYKEAISLYKKKKDFNLLIFLFLQIYENNNLCSKLLDTFKDIKVLENIKIDKSLFKYLEKFNQIFCNVDIKTNGYNPNELYGIILCYLYFYDLDNKYFSSNINLLHKENPEVLYNILIKFQSYFLKPLNQDLEFYNKFIGYSIQNKDLKTTEKVLKYIKDIETYLNVINTYKDDFIDYFEKPIKIKSELKLVKKKFIIDKKEVNEINNIIELIKKIISFSENHKKLLIYLTNHFWSYLLNQYKIADRFNINNCCKLRKLFKEYYKLILNLYKEVDKEKEEDKYKIRKDIKSYYDRDEFGYILNKNVKEYLSKNKETNSKKLAMIAQFNPYFNIEDEDDKKRYVNYKDTSIFDYINFAETDEGFIKAFRALKFEEVFKENIKSYLIKMVSKIENIETFGIIMKLINLENNQDKIKEYYDLLKDKYNYIINEIELLKEEKLTKAIIEILCEFITKIFLNEKSCNFIKNNIEKLDNSIKSLIYNELIKINKDEKFKEMKDYIFSYFIKNLDDADNIIKLIGNLSSEKDKKQFFKELIEQCKFKKEEFYFDHGNKKIKLLSDLNEKLKEINDEKEGNIFKLGKELLGDELDSILDGIRKDLDSNEFSKNKIEEILQFKDKEKNREEIIKKLGLIKIIINDYNPEEIYNKLKEKIEKMNDIVDRLNFIKNSLSIFHKVKFRDEINNIAKIIEDIEKRPINDFDSETMKNSITDLLKKEEKSKKINKVKDFLIFKIIFKNTKGNDQEARFDNAHEYLKNIKKSFKNYQEKIEKDKTKREEVLNEILEKEDNKKMFEIIKDELSKKKEPEIEKFIEQMIENFDIKDKQLENDLKIFFKSKKYEIDIKSIKYFFDAFLDKKLTITKFISLSEMNLKQVKSILVKLKKDNIYDYESESYYYKIFTSLYNKREALDFLMEKITSNTKIDYLKNRLDPTQRRINIKHIEDTIECLKCLSEIIHKDEKEILKNIKNLDKDKVNKFISYSKIYNAIKELDDNDNDNDNDNIVKRITEINQDAYFKISDDKEKFSYKKNKETIDVEIPELIKLKNQINIKPKITKEKNKSNEEMEEKDPYEDKCKNLIFFKDLISDIEEIYEKIKILRTKGCYIPVDIKIEIEFPEFHCFVDGRPYDKEEIKKFLFNVRIDFEKTLNQKYNDEKYLRFLYGKLFRKIQLHNSGFIEIFEIIRYILNITDNSKKILDVKDYAQEYTSSGNYYIFYSDDNNNMLKNISGYIISLFDKNKLDLEKHYNKMLVKEENKYKGFYFKECKKTSMEEYIIYLFYEKLGKEILPISQNILICSKETSTEEIQSFLYRAILCDYNTLFIFEIIESLSESQYNKIFTYIDKILSIKLEKYKTDKNDSAT